MSKAMDEMVADLESGQTPNDQTSQESPSNSPGNSDGQLDALIAKLTPRLEEIVKRAAYSEKDKGIASAKRDASSALKVANSMRDTIDKFNSYVTRYGSEEAAYAELERDQRIEEALSGKSVQEPASVGTDARPWGVRQKEILESAGLEMTDSRVREFAISMRESGASPDKYLEELASKTFEWSQADLDKPKPNPSTVANPTKGVSTVTNFSNADTEALGQELITLSSDYSKNAKRIEEINQELRRRDTGAN